MTFEEILPRTKIIITVTNGTDMQARFMTKVMRNTGEYILVIPFMHKGHRINFSSNQVKIHMDVRDNTGVLWNFKNCKVTTIKKDGLIFHKLISPMRNGIENRRGGRRFYVWEPCVITLENTEIPIYTNLRDVGMTGISFVIEHKKAMELKEGTKFGCNFKSGNDGALLDVNAMIVRKEKLEKYTIYGCKLDNPSEKYVNYVKGLEKKTVVVDVDF